MPMRIAVLMGGTSDEREVSLASGAQVAHALRQAGHDVLAVDTARGPISADEEERLRERGVGEAPPPSPGEPLDERHLMELVRDPALAGVDLYFLALHGGTGEDGTVQALLDASGVAYTGSDRLGCSLAMDKEVTKRLLRDAGVPTPPWMAGEFTADVVEARLGLPVIVKAAGGGSSLRLFLAHDRPELEAALGAGRGFRDLVLIEQYVKGREFTVGVLGDEALPVGEIIPEHEIFDYACKYQPGLASEIFPADVPPDRALAMQELALTVHRALRLRDYSRVDFLMDGGGGLWCLEANTLPGMTANSLLPRAARAAGMDLAALCDRIVALALARH
jgi:D-alanine-D-alanine ligase